MWCGTSCIILYMLGVQREHLEVSSRSHWAKKKKIHMLRLFNLSWGEYKSGNVHDTASSNIRLSRAPLTCTRWRHREDEVSVAEADATVRLSADQGNTTEGFKTQNHQEPHAPTGHVGDAGERFVRTVFYLCRLMLKLQPQNIKTYSNSGGANYITVPIMVAKM